MITAASAAGGSRGTRPWPIWLALGLIIVPLLSLVTLQSYEAVSRSPRTALRQRLVERTFELTFTMEALKSALLDAEWAQRGYLLTGVPAYLDPYRTATRSIPPLLARLDRLTAREPDPHRQIEELDRRIGRKLAELQSTIVAYQSGGTGAVAHIGRAIAGLDAMRSIERRIDGMIDTEKRILAGRLARAGAEDRTMRRIAMASTLLLSILVLAGLALAIANVRSGRRLQAELARRADDVAQSNRELAQRNVELARAGELASRAKEEARRAEKAKGRFLATASHDLRQPLQTVALLNGALRRTLREGDAAEALRQQEEAIASMSRLLNALLDISKLESGIIKPQPGDFPVQALLAQMEREFREVAAAKALRLQVESSEACIHSDPSLVEQIIRNLTSNAIKYTRAGEVRLRAACDPPWVRIEVIDSGVGIAAEQLSMIGEEFYQIGVPSNSTREGYGLGMSIVRRLVKLLGLELGIESEVGRGSNFSLRLPQGARPAAAAARAAAAPVGGDQRPGGHSILLVEDDSGVRNATRMLLRTAGYRVTAVPGLSEALERARESTDIDLLVTDFHLADGETGVQVLARLREALNVPLKAILITGDTSSAIKDVMRDPALRVMSKPVQAEQFLGLLRELLTD